MGESEWSIPCTHGAFTFISNELLSCSMDNVLVDDGMDGAVVVVFFTLSFSRLFVCFLSKNIIDRLLHFPLLSCICFSPFTICQCKSLSILFSYSFVHPIIDAIRK